MLGAGCDIVPLELFSIGVPSVNIAGKFGEVGPEDLGLLLSRGSGNGGDDGGGCPQSRVEGIWHWGCTLHHGLVHIWSVICMNNDEVRG